MAEPLPGNGSDVVRVREVYRLVETMEGKILAELRALDTRWSTRFDAHETEHAQEEANRSSRIRWAVTSILSGVGVLVAIAVAILK